MFCSVHMAPAHCSRPVAVFTLLAALLVGSGCDNAIDPFSGRSTFSIYGYLDLSSQRQFIRVKDMNQPLVRDSTRTIDATVTLENLDEGTSYAMQDSVVAFDGVYTHNFWVDLAVEADTEYRVTVTRPDGVTSQSTTRTPRAIAPVPAPQRGDCLTTFTVRFPGISNTERIRQVAVGFLPESGSSGSGGSPPLDRDRDSDDAPQQEWVWVPAEGFEAISISAYGGTRDVQLRFAPESVLATEIESIDRRPPDIYYPRCLELGDDRIRVAYLQLGPDWFDVPPGEVGFDPAESGFVENGLGFLGALRRDTMAVTVDTANTITVSPGVARSQRGTR